MLFCGFIDLFKVAIYKHDIAKIFDESRSLFVAVGSENICADKVVVFAYSIKSYERIGGDSSVFGP